MFQIRLRILKQSTTLWKASDLGKFDLCIIGGGPAGIAAALRAADYKKKVCLIERWRIGGADLWNGTLPSKTLWQWADKLSKLYGEAAKRLYGESFDSLVSLNEEELRHQMTYVSETKEKQMLTAIEKAGVKLLFGQGSFVDNHEIQVRHPENRECNKLCADNFIIATGSSPRNHPLVKTDGKLVVTSDTIMSNPFPDSLVVVGGGALGCELASIYAELRKTKVYLVDKAPHILPGEDPDVVEKVERALEEAGVIIHHNSRLYDIRPCYTFADCPLNKKGSEDCRSEKTEVEYTIMDRTTKNFSTRRVSQALIAIGRRPSYKGLGLENTSLRMNNGVISVSNPYGQCEGVPHMYTAGDAGGDMNSVTVAEGRGKECVDFMFGSHTVVSPTRNAIARVAFLTTAVATVGHNERKCRKLGISYLAAKVSHETVSRSVVGANTTGFVKIIVSNDAKHTILGLQAVGLNASTLVDLGSLAINQHQTAMDCADRLTAYPSVSEAFQECLRMILGTSQIKPGVLSCNELKCWVPESCSSYGLAYPKSFLIGGSERRM